MKIQTEVVGIAQTNCYILSDGKTAVIIDPGDNAQQLLRILKEQGLTLTYIILTHGHFDHILGAQELCQKTNAKLCASHMEKDFLQNIDYVFPFPSSIPYEGLTPDIFLKDEDIIISGDINLKVLETPGHTVGGISLLSGKALFCGDTLFFESVGRSDLPTGSSELLEDSINNILMLLDDDITVYPGHGPKTTIGYEREHNPFVGRSLDE